MNDDLGPTCASCLAYHADAEDGSCGECRCHAPKPDIGMKAGFSWPVVDGDDWCLQHRQTTAPFELTMVPAAAEGGAGA